MNAGRSLVTRRQSNATEFSKVRQSPVTNLFTQPRKTAPEPPDSPVHRLHAARVNGLTGFILDTISEVWWRNLVADPVFTSSNGLNSAWRSANDGPIKL